MAQIEITPWDVAQPLGLEYLGTGEPHGDDEWYCHYNFSFNGKAFKVNYGRCTGNAECVFAAKNVAALRVLEALGKMVTI